MKDIKDLIKEIKGQDELLSLEDVSKLTATQKRWPKIGWARLVLVFIALGVLIGSSIHFWPKEDIPQDVVQTIDKPATDSTLTDTTILNETIVDKGPSTVIYPSRNRVNDAAPRTYVVQSDNPSNQDTTNKLTDDGPPIQKKTVKANSEIYPKSEKFYYDGWEKEVQTYTIDPSKPNEIIGKEGTIVILKPNSICGNAGNLTADIQLTEYYKTEDMLLAQLTTSSNGRMLESAGMIELKATSNGKELTLCKPATILFPSDKYKNDGFVGFMGDWDDPHNTINWEPTGGVNRSFYGGTSIPDCKRKANQVIRCNWKVRKQELAKRGRSKIRQDLRNDEVIRKIRGRFWFQDSCTSKLYDDVYEGIKYKMKDTTSASAYQQCYREQRDARALRMFLDSLRGEVGFNPEILNQETGYILAEVANFGAINCDRFTNRPVVKNYTYKVGRTEGVISSRLVFHDIKSILTGHQTSRSEVRFDKIPAGEMVTLIIVKYLADKILVGHQQLKTGETPDMEFTEVERSNLPDVLKRIASKVGN